MQTIEEENQRIRSNFFSS